VSLTNGDGKPRQLINAGNQLAARFSLLSEEEFCVCVCVRERERERERELSAQAQMQT